MSEPFLTIAYIERYRVIGEIERVEFLPGVNLLVGRPNTGKTKWLQTLDFLLGDSGDSPYEPTEESPLLDLYIGAKVGLVVGGDEWHVERRWKEAGLKTKIIVNGEALSPQDFQTRLLEKLNIPIVSFPKGNPMSGQTWPYLSFRILLRHIYRQQRFWSGLVDQQSDGEQYAALLQFLGLAEKMFSPEYGELIRLRLEVEKLRARREYHAAALNELAVDLLSEPELTVGVSETTVRNAKINLKEKQRELLAKRKQILAEVVASATPAFPSSVESLGERRAHILQALEEKRSSHLAVTERSDEIRRYISNLRDELERMDRAEDACSILADLKVTHCPACDQSVAGLEATGNECFLCHQRLPDDTGIARLGVVRLLFEKRRIEAELTEGEQLLATLVGELKAISKENYLLKNELFDVEARLAPARQALSGIVQERISEVDMEIGELSERRRHLERLAEVVASAATVDREIGILDARIAPLKTAVNEATWEADFDQASTLLSDGMNAYLSAINELRPGTWKHSSISVVLTKRDFHIRVGSRRWSSALGGTDTLFLLMAYQYGLLSLSDVPNCHYPGLSIIDFPAEFSGEAVKDIENFVIQPFINLLKKESFEKAQVILTGPAFTGLADVNRVPLNHVYVAK